MSRTRGLLLLILGIALRGQAPVQAYVWMGELPADPGPLRARLEPLRLGVALEPTADPGAVANLGLPFYLDQIIPRAILGLSEEEFLDARGEDPLQDGPILRPVCLRSPGARDQADSALEAAALRFQDQAPDFVSLRDEASATRFINPADFCECTACLAALEAATGDPPPDAAHAEEAPKGARAPRPWRTEQARRRIFASGVEPGALVPWNAARRLCDEAFVEFLSRAAGQARARWPGTPVALLGCQMPGAFGGYDYEALVDAFDLLEIYDLRAARAVAQGMARRPLRLLATLTRPEGGPSAARARILEAALHGVDAFTLFDSDFARGGGAEELPGWMRAAAEAVEELRSQAWQRWTGAVPLEPDAAILHSMPSLRADWILSTRPDGQTWPKRLSSYEAREGPAGRSRESWYELLRDLGMRPSFVSPQRLRRGDLARSGIRILVLPRCLALDREEARAVLAFAAQGRVVLADSHIGIFDGSLRRHEVPVLDTGLGIHQAGSGADRIAALTTPPRAAGLPYPIADTAMRSAGGEAQLRPRGFAAAIRGPGTGRSRTFVLNLDVGAYAEDRESDPARARWLRELVQAFLTAAEVGPAYELSGTGPEPGVPPLRLHLRRARSGEVLLAVAAGTRRHGEAGEPLPARAYRVALKSACDAEDLLGGRRFRGTHVLEGETHPGRPALWLLRP
jgi:hypothetical protein